MDKNGNYKVVYGLKLDQIPKGDLKVIINGHGELGKINNRGVDEIAQYISTIERATGEDSSIRKVSLISCDLGREYARTIVVLSGYFSASRNSLLKI
jgi:hypothetical protein